jgi:hypothetical protein
MIPKIDKFFTKKKNLTVWPEKKKKKKKNNRNLNQTNNVSSFPKRRSENQSCNTLKNFSFDN